MNTQQQPKAEDTTTKAPAKQAADAAATTSKPLPLPPAKQTVPAKQPPPPPPAKQAVPAKKDQTQAGNEDKTSTALGDLVNESKQGNLVRSTLSSLSVDSSQVNKKPKEDLSDVDLGEHENGDPKLTATLNMTEADYQKYQELADQFDKNSAEFVKAQQLGGRGLGHSVSGTGRQLTAEQRRKMAEEEKAAKIAEFSKDQTASPAKRPAPPAKRQVTPGSPAATAAAATNGDHPIDVNDDHGLAGHGTPRTGEKSTDPLLGASEKASTGKKKKASEDYTKDDATDDINDESVSKTCLVGQTALYYSLQFVAAAAPVALVSQYVNLGKVVHNAPVLGGAANAMIAKGIESFTQHKVAQGLRDYNGANNKHFNHACKGLAITALSTVGGIGVAAIPEYVLPKGAYNFPSAMIGAMAFLGGYKLTEVGIRAITDLSFPEYTKHDMRISDKAIEAFFDAFLASAFSWTIQQGMNDKFRGIFGKLGGADYGMPCMLGLKLGMFYSSGNPREKILELGGYIKAMGPHMIGWTMATCYRLIMQATHAAGLSFDEKAQQMTPMQTFVNESAAALIYHGGVGPARKSGFFKPAGSRDLEKGGQRNNVITSHAPPKDNQRLGRHTRGSN